MSLERLDRWSLQSHLTLSLSLVISVMLKFIVLFFVFAAVAQGEDAPKPAEDVPAASADTEAVIDEEAVGEWS